jgi:hypothetical protein
MNLALDSWEQILRDPDYGYRLARLHACQDRQPGRPLVLLLGSSRTMFGLRPRLLSSGGSGPVVFNFGVPGQGAPLSELICFRRLRAAGVRPAWVLVEILPAMLQIFYATEDPSFIHHLAGQELPLATRYSPHPLRLYRDWVKDRLLPCCSYRFTILGGLAADWVPSWCWPDVWLTGMDALGWWVKGSLGMPPTRTARIDHARKQYLRFLEHLAIHENPDGALRELLDDCRRDGIKVALYLMPEGPLFRSWYRPVTNVILRGYLARLKQAYGVEVIDARNWIGDEDLFYDSHHLRPRGATRFTKQFGRRALDRLLSLNPQSRKEH